MYGSIVGGYGRTARRGGSVERGSNGNELAKGAIGAICRRSFVRCSFSFDQLDLVSCIHGTKTLTQAYLGWRCEKQCGENERTSGLQ